MLMVRQIKKPTIHKVDVVPEVALALPKQEAKPTSKKPAITNKIQFITVEINLSVKIVFETLIFCKN